MLLALLLGEMPVQHPGNNRRNGENEGRDYNAHCGYFHDPTLLRGRNDRQSLFGRRGIFRLLVVLMPPPGGQRHAEKGNTVRDAHPDHDHQSLIHSLITVVGLYAALSTLVPQDSHRVLASSSSKYSRCLDSYSSEMALSLGSMILCSTYVSTKPMAVIT